MRALFQQTRPEDFPSLRWFLLLGALMVPATIIAYPFELGITALSYAPGSVSWLSFPLSICNLAITIFPCTLASMWIAQWSGLRRSGLWAGFIVGFVGGALLGMLSLIIWLLSPHFWLTWISLAFFSWHPTVQITPLYLLLVFPGSYAVFDAIFGFFSTSAGLRVLDRQAAIDADLPLA